MPATRSSRRAATRSNTKRTILSALDENKPLDDHPLHTTKHDIQTQPSVSQSQSLPDLDVFKPESIEVLLQDIVRQVKAKQESLSIKSAEINKHQQEVFFVNSMKLEKSVKKMTIRDFNAKYMAGNNSSSGNGSSNNIIDVMKQIMHSSTLDETNHNTNNNNKKRVRQPNNAHTNLHAQLHSHHHLPLETPVRQLKPSFPSRTPGTILRTVRKNEVLYSSNGSPVHQAEEGDLIATVSKKRRGNANASHDEDDSGMEIGGAVFDISVGDGRMISLSDPSTMEHLTNEMKSTAKNQLNVLQNQLSQLLSKLN